MNHHSLSWLAAICFFPMPLACLWDSDTLVVERAAFPEVHEMIAGHFPRHSPAYYEWRINRISAIPVEERTRANYDDIAVAHEKLGQHDEAIRVMEEKIERWRVEGRYESEANLGTFLIHSGRYAEGLNHIDRALEINPNAHFGRERYQRMLVDFLSKLDDPQRRPLWPDLHPSAMRYFYEQQMDDWTEDPKATHTATLQGILGMLRFGNHDSPVLLETLGDLLVDESGLMHGEVDDAKQLAARAYLIASYQFNEPERNRYRKKAEQALSMQVDQDIDRVEAELQRELADAKALQDRIAEDEATWIADGIDVDAAFDAKYHAPERIRIGMRNRTPAWVRTIATGAALGSIGLLLVVAIRRRLTSPHTQKSEGTV